MKIRLPFNYLLISSGAFFFIYTFLRAIFVPISVDEATAFLSFRFYEIDNIFKLPLYYFMENQYVYPALMKISNLLLGNSEFAIRLPSTLFYIVYLYAVFKILALFFKKSELLIPFVFIISIPFVIELFALGRGYGVSLSAYFLFLFYLTKSLHENSPISTKDTFIISGLIFLSILSNLLFLNIIVFTLGPYIFLRFFQCLKKEKNTIDRKENRFRNLIRFCVILTSAFLVLYVLTAGVIGGLLGYVHGSIGGEFGGNRGYFEDTYASLIIKFFYGGIQITLKAARFFGKPIFLLVLFLALKAFIQINKKKNKNEFSYIILFLSLILASHFVGYYFQNKFFKIPFPMKRHIVFLLPLFFFLGIFSIEFFKKNLGFTTVRIYSLLSIGLILSIIFYHISCFNLSHFQEWPYDSASKELVLFLAEKNKKQKEITVAIEPWIEMAPKFYKFKFRENLLRFFPAKKDLGDYDYYYFIPKMGQNQFFEKLNLKIIWSHKSGTVLGVKK